MPKVVLILHYDSDVLIHQFFGFEKLIFSLIIKSLISFSYTLYAIRNTKKTKKEFVKYIDKLKYTLEISIITVIRRISSGKTKTFFKFQFIVTIFC